MGKSASFARASLLRHLAFYFLALVAITLLPGWHELDMEIFRAVHSPTPVDWSANHLALIDIPYPSALEPNREAGATSGPRDDPEEPQRLVYRDNVLALLQHLSSRPQSRLKAVLLDISFTNRDTRVDELAAAIKHLQSTQHVKVYAALRLTDSDNHLTPAYMDKHARKIYDALDGKGHTRFSGYDIDTVWYAPAIALPCNNPSCSGVELPRALVLVATNNRRNFSTESKIYVNLGPADAYRPFTFTYKAKPEGGYAFYSYEASASLLGGDPTMDIEYLIVGSPRIDVEEVSGRPGPEILSWALLDQVRTEAEGPPERIVNQPSLLLLLTVAFSAVAAGIFYAIFHFRPRWRSKPLRLTLISLCTCIVLLAGIVTSIAATGYTYTQLTLIVAGMFLSLALCWHYSAQWLIRALMTNEVDLGPVDDEYDVFISYSRTEENAQWVVRNVFEPLTRVRTTSGRPLRIFFDQRTIRPGTDWYVSLAKGINGCRVFVPIYSQDYFEKKFCRFEIKKAFIRRDGSQDEGLIHPLARPGVSVPIEFSHVHFQDISKDFDFLQDLIAHVLGRVAN